ncbi:hypothetical protein IJH24_02660 [Candidatus Saccharibacteria bacterium]|nr:hypothetical protein [Candidatus Saccharibacteria bacterium]
MLRGRYKKATWKDNGFLYSDKAIISVKEARKILGKEVSDSLSDADLMEVIGIMSKLADVLLSEEFVPNNIMAVQ